MNLFPISINVPCKSVCWYNIKKTHPDLPSVPLVPCYPMDIKPFIFIPQSFIDMTRLVRIDFGTNTKGTSTLVSHPDNPCRGTEIQRGDTLVGIKGSTFFPSETSLMKAGCTSHTVLSQSHSRALDSSYATHSHSMGPITLGFHLA